MARPFVIEIVESEEFLEKSLRQAKSAEQAERLRMLWWLKTGKVKAHQELSRLLGRSPSTVTRWLKSYRTGGLDALLERKKAPGKPAEITGDLFEKLKSRLDEPQGFSSYRAVQQWLEKESGKKMNYKTVHKTVRYRLGAKLKVPRPCNIKQEQEAVSLFKKTLEQP